MTGPKVWMPEGTPCICEQCNLPFRCRKSSTGRFCGQPCSLAFTRATAHPLRRERRVWRDMVQRCTKPNCRAYKDYGGRGITVCDRWLASSANFLADMGPAPSPQHSIDRIDNEGSYEPGNCRWATREEQQRNKRDSRRLTHEGETMCIAEWAERLGICAHTIESRLAKNWAVARALSTPVAASRARAAPDDRARSLSNDSPRANQEGSTP